jgi:hypothetical protein
VRQKPLRRNKQNYRPPLAPYQKNENFTDSEESAVTYGSQYTDFEEKI